MITIGLQHKEELITSSIQSAKNLKSGGLEVLGTPALIALMEQSAWKSVLPFMQEGFDTVGTYIEINHLSPTPIGSKIHAICTLSAINKRELTFHIKAYDNKGEIANATHKRVIINILSFQQRADNKLK